MSKYKLYIVVVIVYEGFKVGLLVGFHRDIFVGVAEGFKIV